MERTLPSREVLQRGQVDRLASHRSRQSLWKAWLQTGKILTLSPSSNSPRHIQHSAASSTSITADWCKIIGRDFTISSWRPRRREGGGAWPRQTQRVQRTMKEMSTKTAKKAQIGKGERRWISWQSPPSISEANCQWTGRAVSYDDIFRPPLVN